MTIDDIENELRSSEKKLAVQQLPYPSSYLDPPTRAFLSDQIEEINKLTLKIKELKELREKYLKLKGRGRGGGNVFRGSVLRPTPTAHTPTPEEIHDAVEKSVMNMEFAKLGKKHRGGVRKKTTRKY